MDINGQNVQQITHHGRELDGPPVWSPDGRWIAFMSGDSQADLGQQVDWGLYVTDPQGHHENLITRFNPLTNLSVSGLVPSGLVPR